MATRGKVVSLFRQCLQELKALEEMKSGPKEHFMWQRSPVYNGIKTWIYNNDGDPLLLQTYISLLHGTSSSQKLIELYRGVGERSVEETARIVGLKLPKLYEENS